MPVVQVAFNVMELPLQIVFVLAETKVGLDIKFTKTGEVGTLALSQRVVLFLHKA
jgi:hypothetical protein